MDAPKLKIIDWNRNLFPELALDLEKNGQLQPILIDEDGFVHDGAKRVILCGLEQLGSKIVDRTSECSNIHSLNTTQKRALAKLIFDQTHKNHKVEESVQIIKKRYGVSRATIYRWLDLGGKDVSNETKSIGKERMYKDTTTWNPFVGCYFECAYCKPSFQENHYFVKHHRECGLCNPHLHPERLDLKKIPDEKIIFMCGDSDVSFCKPDDFGNILKIMGKDKKQDRIWFVQSKDPKYFGQFLPYLPKNTILLTTLETNRDGFTEKISKAPPPSYRYETFKNLDYPRKIVTVEPIMDFDLDIFAEWIINIQPEAVFIGYNSHPKQVHLIEPSMEKTLDLIVALKNKGIRVLTNGLRTS